VPGTNHTEVGAVNGGDLSDVQAFRSGHYRRVDRPEREILVFPDQMGHARPVLDGDRFNLEDACHYVVKKALFGLVAQLLPYEVGRLSDGKRRDDQWSWMLLN
jgi:hypothetical protein